MHVRHGRSLRRDRIDRGSEVPIRRAVLALVLVALAAAVGAFVYAKPLPEAHELTRAGRFYHPLEDVWAVVLDVEHYADWRSDLASVEREPDVRGHAVWREVPKSGSPVTWETVETLKDRRLMRCIIDQGGPYGGCFKVEIIRRDDGAIVTVLEKYAVHSTLFRFTHTVAGRRAGLDRWLADLGKKFGETTWIADLPKDLRDPPKPKEAEPAAAEGGEGPLR